VQARKCTQINLVFGRLEMEESWMQWSIERKMRLKKLGKKGSDCLRECNT